MKIIEDCWDDIDTFNCQYGAHIFDGVTAKIYVNHWLATSSKIRGDFCRINDEGFVGHCILVFDGVKTFDFSILQWFEKNGEVAWRDPVVFHYDAEVEGEIRRYEFEGSLQGFPSSVSVCVEAKRFSLHILGGDEPARES
ncbi:hypothetical protein ACI2S3_23735 [Ralstonia nicotianae]|uniref:Uncharacterized protein n=1 Tax=Ralstonia nicotianae (strain ATCC BAA-1114 / GMI1000) TaxID=267608 RepID=Q8XSD0_RALN1|nr:hypothetical protein [Ralstonia pseudosolanacearum]AZU58516.1 hypothetical protein CFM90_20030 [Ralstonia solanacearum]AST29570.1 hypothetical protein CDC45_20340 [Ralstonia pseudosolanacearum]MCK4140591.1 hypothetical protein [Ralstonia pseudosolanacearum]MDC6286162.1 hypothetical protein [Ralstonia pseudosolanacearum]MDD7787799.1 hypothetical protein [Ralstonia pseudosolanacearum]